MKIPAIVLKNKVSIGIAAVIILLAATSFFYFRQYQKAQWRLNHPTEVAKQEAKTTIAAVGKLMMLPADEEPTVMQVTDVAKLKDQPFFANAQNGDKVIIYTKAKKAILYRVETNKIVDVAPVNIGNSATPSATVAPATPSAAPKIIIR